MASHIRKFFFWLQLFILVFFTQSCHVFRYVYWNYADVTDYKKFPADTVLPSPHPIVLPVSGKVPDLKLPAEYQASDHESSLNDFLRNQQTLAFLIIRNDTVIYDAYFKGYERTSVIPSFSLAKSFISALTGIAINEGYIKSLQQPVTDFLPELRDPKFRKVTLENLLTMRSGIKFNEGYSNPFGEAAKFYYGLNLKKYTLKLKVKGVPGASYDYQSGNTELMAMVLERATGRRTADYFQEKLWQPMGAAHMATWSLDSKKHREVKAFCCINSAPEDFALFGQLYLHGGNSGQLQVVPSDWIKETLTIRNDSRDSHGYPYTYFWRVLENGDYFAKGILGQFIYVSPSRKTVIVRMGEKAGDLDWPRFFGQICDQL
jgi:CubicO group peptidase (beta-lactamase class C family)